VPALVGLTIGIIDALPASTSPTCSDSPPGSSSARYLVLKALVGECVEVVAHEEKVVIGDAGAEVVRHGPVGPGEVVFVDLADPALATHTRHSSTNASRARLPGPGSNCAKFLRTAAATGTLRLELS
jgi:hypothetical protein